MPKVARYNERKRVSYKTIAIKDGDIVTNYSQEDPDVWEYEVRGLSPAERRISVDLLPPDPPMPPMKKTESVVLDTRNSPVEVKDNLVPDYDDPTYKKAMKEYEQIQLIWGGRSDMYVLSRCVKGFDIEDNDIANELGEDAVQVDWDNPNIDSLVKRLDQIGRIIRKDMDGAHLDILLRVAMRMTGVRSSDINFT